MLWGFASLEDDWEVDDIARLFRCFSLLIRKEKKKRFDLFQSSGLSVRTRKSRVVPFNEGKTRYRCNERGYWTNFKLPPCMIFVTLVKKMRWVGAPIPYNPIGHPDDAVKLILFNMSGRLRSLVLSSFFFFLFWDAAKGTWEHSSLDPNVRTSWSSCTVRNFSCTRNIIYLPWSPSLLSCNNSSHLHGPRFRFERQGSPREVICRSFRQVRTMHQYKDSWIWMCCRWL